MSILDQLKSAGAADIAKMVMDTINNDPDLKKGYETLVSGDDNKKEVLTGMMTKLVQDMAAKMAEGDGGEGGNVLGSVLNAFKNN